MPPIALALAALALYTHNLAAQNYGNMWQAAAIKSMLTSWHNFFYLSFDPGGFLALDKPPLGLWLQALSVSALGFSGIALHLPQAMAGALCVALMYVILRPSFGWQGGLAGALVLGATPLFVATSRSTLVESTLLCTLLLAILAATRAVQGSRPALAVLAAAVLGLAFNVKYTQALMVAPALFGYLLLARWIPLARRLVVVLVAFNVLMVLCYAWIWAVDRVPVQNRPFIENSGNNTVVGLLRNTTLTRVKADGIPSSPDLDQTGRFSIFTMPLASTISGLVPLALCGLLMAGLCGSREQKREALLWGLWLVPILLFFSISDGTIHIYYFVMLAPGTAAGVAMVLHFGCRWLAARRGLALLVPLALLASAFFVNTLAHLGPGRVDAALFGKVGLLSGQVLLALTLVAMAPELRRWPRPALSTALACALLAVLAVPAFLSWRVTDNYSMQIPIGGDEHLHRLAESLSRGDPLLDYLRSQRQGEQFLVATLSALEASPIIVATSEPVMAMGGYAGGDPVLTPEALGALVNLGKVRFFLIPSKGQSQPALIRWIAKNGRVVRPSEWGPSAVSDIPASREEGDLVLYDCAAGATAGATASAEPAKAGATAKPTQASATAKRSSAASTEKPRRASNADKPGRAGAATAPDLPI